MSQPYDNIDEFLSTLDNDGGKETLKNIDNKDYQQDLYKKWFKSKTQSGFLGIKL